MVRIACVGITVMDRIYYVEGLPTEGGKYVAKRYTEVGGGPAATAAVAAAKLGAQVDFIGRVGDDDTGNSLLAELESLGVNTRYTRRYTQAMSSQSAIMVDAKGERIIVNYPSPDLLPDAGWLNEIDFSQWDVVLADVRWHDGAKQAFTLARQAGVMTVLDGDITPQDISELVALSDHAAFSEPGLARLTGMSEAIDALKKQKCSQMDMSMSREAVKAATGWKKRRYATNRVLPWRWWILPARAMFFMAHWHLAWQADTPSKRLSDSPAALPR